MLDLDLLLALCVGLQVGESARSEAKSTAPAFGSAVQGRPKDTGTLNSRQFLLGWCLFRNDGGVLGGPGKEGPKGQANRLPSFSLCTRRHRTLLLLCAMLFLPVVVDRHLLSSFASFSFRYTNIHATPVALVATAATTGLGLILLSYKGYIDQDAGC